MPCTVFGHVIVVDALVIHIQMTSIGLFYFGKLRSDCTTKVFAECVGQSLHLSNTEQKNPVLRVSATLAVIRAPCRLDESLIGGTERSVISMRSEGKSGAVLRLESG
jgi:hypothetical protein